MGFVNEVVAPSELMDAARRWAGAIMKASPLAVRATKEIALRGQQIMLRGIDGGDAQHVANGGIGRRALPWQRIPVARAKRTISWTVRKYGA
jgi:enoyl-CoA hydratase/carnithine racemase